jgi:hypothetical protein
MSAGQAGTITLNGVNAYVRFTNSAPMRYYVLEIIQGTGGTNTANPNTNYSQPKISGQLLTMPTNTAWSRMWMYVIGDSVGNTNTVREELKP